MTTTAKPRTIRIRFDSYKTDWILPSGHEQIDPNTAKPKQTVWLIGTNDGRPCAYGPHTIDRLEEQGSVVLLAQRPNRRFRAHISELLVKRGPANESQ